MTLPSDPFWFYAVASALLFALSLRGFVLSPHAAARILSLNVMGSAIFLFFGAVSRRNWDRFPDPVPQAIVITGIVVAVSSTAVALALARRLASRRGGETG